MSRVYGTPDGRPPRIDQRKVSTFFEERAARIPELGPTRAVIYQDKHPDLAERRDQHERSLLTPKLGLTGGQRLLDVGCGTGRWTRTLRGRVARYHGIDFAPGLIEHARHEHGDPPQVVFSVADVSDFSLSQIDVDAPFDRVLVSGVFIYLNDDALDRALMCLDQVMTADALLLLREPVAQDLRLSLVDHHSEDLDADYHAIYRTREELLRASAAAFGASRRALVDHGYVYEDANLNNRRETRQEWFLFSTPAS
jgi:cyclopropane fatty-acyl-phospholipid synthase-like methyltransferase